MDFNLVNIISVISVFQALLFAIYLLFNNPRQNTNNYFMAVFLIIYAIDFSAAFSSKYLYPVAPNIGLLLSNTLFLAPPSLFLFVRSSLYTDFKLNRYDLLHLLPFLIVNLACIPYYYLYNIDPQLAPANAPHVFEKYCIPAIYISLHLSSIIYLLAAFILLRKYRSLFLENFSNSDSNTYAFLLQLIIILGITDMFSLVKNYALFQYWRSTYDITLLLVNFTALIMICWIIFKALKSPELFKGIPSSTLEASKILKAEKKYARQSGDKGKWEENKRIKLIKDYMEDSNPFLEPSLTLEHLAKQVNMSSKELSILINHTMGLHFFDFVNEYRIGYAMKLLSDPAQRELTVLEILYDSGFNSKSSFNTEFKKRTGQTPTEYRGNYL